MNPIAKFSFFLITLCAPLILDAQSDLLYRKITLSVNSKTIKYTLSEISKAGGLKFSYNTEIIKGDSIVSCQFKNQSIEECLNILFKGNVRYKTSGDHIILLANTDKNAKKSKLTVTGTVVDSYTGQKMKDVSIYDVDEQYSTITNANGYYKLIIPSGEPYRGLCYCKKGFVDTIIVIRSTEQSKIDIKLNPAIVADPPKFEKLEPVIEDYPLPIAIIPREVIVNADNLEHVSDLKFAQVSFLPSLGTNLSSYGVVENRLSFNILAGYSKGVKGFELGSLFNIVKENVSGLQLGGIGNMVGGYVKGAQIGGFFSMNSKSVTGIQLSGFANTALDSLTGVQLSGFANILKGHMNGAQISGFYNMTTKNVDGLQIAGFANTAWEDVKLFQVAGFANLSRGKVDGVQIAGFANMAKSVNFAQISGFMNVASDEIKGVQISTFLNIADKVKGLQLGFINISDTTSGLNLGFLSYVHKGYHRFEVSADETFYANAAFKTGTKRFYNVFQAGIDPTDAQTWYAGYGFGTETKGKRRLIVGLDLTGNQIFEGKPTIGSTITALFKINLNIGLRIFKGSAITVGPSANFLITNQSDETGTYVSTLQPPYAKQYLHEQFLAHYWIGGRLAFRF